MRLFHRPAGPLAMPWLADSSNEQFPKHWFRNLAFDCTRNPQKKAKLCVEGSLDLGKTEKCAALFWGLLHGHCFSRHGRGEVCHQRTEQRWASRTKVHEYIDFIELHV